MAEKKQKIPDDSFPSFVSEWWVDDEQEVGVCRGRLIRAFLPHVDQEPRTVTPIERQSPTDHRGARVRIEPLRVGDRRKEPPVPIAGLPTPQGEVHTAYRAKFRPCVVVGGDQAPEVGAVLRAGRGKWQTAPTILVAPYYGVEQGATRGGWSPEFVQRIRHGEYPQYIWDSLPLSGSAHASILRIDHIQPIGRHVNTYELTQYKLSSEALEILDDWIGWLMTGGLREGGPVYTLREELPALA